HDQSFGLVDEGAARPRVKPDGCVANTTKQSAIVHQSSAKVGILYSCPHNERSNNYRLVVNVGVCYARFTYRDDAHLIPRLACVRDDLASVAIVHPPRVVALVT